VSRREAADERDIGRDAARWDVPAEPTVSHVCHELCITFDLPARALSCERHADAVGPCEPIE
jgi:hypothetical protein